MSRLLDRLLEPIEYVPCIPGLTVIEPPPDQVPLSWLAWDDAVRAMDDTAAYATQHPEICR
jgi:hypothetical protein